MIAFNFHAIRILSGLALALFAAPVHAAALIASGFYEDNKSTSCGSSANPVISCGLSLTAVPANSTLIVENVSCRVTISSTSTVIFIFYIYGNNKGQSVLNFTTPTSHGGVRDYQFNQAITKVFTAGQIPRFTIGVSPPAGLNWSCNIAGQIRSTNPI